jgi:hypothetical protein
MKFLIVNLTKLEPVEMAWCSGELGIPERHRPTRIHEQREPAEKELVRLAKAFPDQKFFLFQCVATAECREVTRQITVTEKVARMLPYPV